MGAATPLLVYAGRSPSSRDSPRYGVPITDDGSRMFRPPPLVKRGGKIRLPLWDHRRWCFPLVPWDWGRRFQIEYQNLDLGRNRPKGRFPEILAHPSVGAISGSFCPPFRRHKFPQHNQIVLSSKGRTIAKFKKRGFLIFDGL